MTNHTLSPNTPCAHQALPLSQVDRVKKRMEAARDTMSEVSGLASLMESVEQVFAGTDLRLMATTLARMRQVSLRVSP